MNSIETWISDIPPHPILIDAIRGCKGLYNAHSISAHNGLNQGNMAVTGNIYYLAGVNTSGMDPFIGEIRIFAWGLEPSGWARCDGRLLQIVQNQALYSLLRNRYGGDGKTTFALPNLQGRVPVCASSAAPSELTPRPLASAGGSSGVALDVSQMPTHSHNHQLMGANQSNADSPAGRVPGKVSGTNFYSDATSIVNMATEAISLAKTGQGQAHNNMQPSMALNFCIALTGYYPPKQ